VPLPTDCLAHAQALLLDADGDLFPSDVSARPDPDVIEALSSLGRHLTLAAVSSSALSRLQGCFEATDLELLIPAERRFSAEDSLVAPASKPNPAVYRYACAELGVATARAVAVEDSMPGVLSAVRAGCPTIGNVHFVPPMERVERGMAMREAGALTVVCSWGVLTQLLLPALVLRDEAAALP
jgi:HAD superfamily hydrolase (TIGR01509 family)